MFRPEPHGEHTYISNIITLKKHHKKTKQKKQTKKNPLSFTFYKKLNEKKIILDQILLDHMNISDLR